MGGKCHSGNCLYPGLPALHQKTIFPTEAVSSRSQRKPELPGSGNRVLPRALEGLASQETLTKKVTMKETLIWYLLRRVSLININREMKKLSQENIQAFGCSLARARIAGEEPQKLTLFHVVFINYAARMLVRPTETCFASFLCPGCLDIECHFQFYTFFFSHF